LITTPGNGLITTRCKVGRFGPKRDCDFNILSDAMRCEPGKNVTLSCFVIPDQSYHKKNNQQQQQQQNPPQQPQQHSSQEHQQSSYDAPQEHQQPPQSSYDTPQEQQSYYDGPEQHYNRPPQEHHNYYPHENSHYSQSKHYQILRVCESSIALGKIGTACRFKDDFTLANQILDPTIENFVKFQCPSRRDDVEVGGYFTLYSGALLNGIHDEKRIVCSIQSTHHGYKY
jgi:hypothetical protein